MNTFTANIKREWLARILAGSKKIEYRDATDYWLDRLDKAGPPPFHLRLINGMKSDSPEALIVVDDVDVEVLSNQIRFHLGKIVSTTRWDDQWNAKFPPAPPPPNDIPSTPSHGAAPCVTLKASTSLIDSLKLPGPHEFDLSWDSAQMRPLLECGAEPFFISLESSASQVAVLAYRIYVKYFEEQARFLVLTPLNPG